MAFFGILDSMKVVIVTSRVTYVPENYRSLLKTIIANDPQRHVAGLIILDNLDASVYKSGLLLFLAGAKKTAFHLFKNIFNLPQKLREKDFLETGRFVKIFKSMNDIEAINFIRDEKIDLIINARTRCIYKKEILQTPRLGCINIHHGILPKYRGTLCDLYALTQGRSAGFSIHQMTSKIDAGSILKIVNVSKGEKNFPLYLERASRMEGEALIELIYLTAQQNKLPEGQINFCERPIYTKNPTLQQIKEFLKQGFIL
ncbi:MAG: hypothetical protein Fur0010_08430 [Bdellovibrio sp.]